MNKNSDNLDIHNETKEHALINNELVVPLYRSFCKDNGLKFHFWNELPKEDFNPVVADKEFELHKEAMELFNQLKPEFNFFKGKIIQFKFTSWAGDFEYNTFEMDEFLKFVGDELRYLKSIQSNSFYKCFINPFGKHRLKENTKVQKRLENLRKKFKQWGEPRRTLLGYNLVTGLFSSGHALACLVGRLWGYLLGNISKSIPACSK